MTDAARIKKQAIFSPITRAEGIFAPDGLHATLLPASGASDSPRSSEPCAGTGGPSTPPPSDMIASEMLPLGFVRLDRQGHIQTINSYALSMLGYTSEELIGRDLHAVVHDPCGPCTMVCPLCHGDPPPLPSEACTCLLWSKSGLRVPVEARVIPSPDGRVVLLQDMRAYTVMAEKLHASFAASPDPQMLFAPDGRLIDANPAAVELFGAERNVLMTEFPRFVPLVQTDGTPSDFAAQLTASLDGGTRTFTWSWYNAHGTEIATDVSLVPIPYAGDQAVFATLHDLRSLLNANNALERERARMHLVLNASPIGMCVLHQGIVKEHNQRLGEMIKLEEGAVFDDVIVNSARREALHEALEQRDCVNEFEMAVYTPDGGIRQVMLTSMRMEWWGEPHVLCWLVDISRLKEVEHALVIARDEAEEATRAKSSFLARMSHEIRTPMNAIIGMSYLCRQTGLSAHQAQYMDKLETAADALVSIFNDILEFTLLQSGQATLLTAPFSLSEVLNETVATHRTKAQSRGLEWKEDIAPDVPDALFGDAARLSQILSGLLSNALKFTEQGHVGVRVERTLESDKHIWLHFCIIDTGIGMSQAQVSEVFELFTQGDLSLTRRHGGIGLGLTISKFLTELLGGRIWAESEQGRGSTFHCTIPFNQPAMPCTVEMPQMIGRPEEYVMDELPIPAPEVVMSETSPTTVGKRVLLVEDNEINQEIACELLRDLGLSPQVAENGALAVAAAAAENFELIFMDIQMPVMDGLEATRIIRSSDSAWAKSVPIIAMTAHALQDDRDQSHAVGMNAHLTKPIDPATLQQVVARWLPSAHTAPPKTIEPENSSTEALYRVYGLNVTSGVANVVGNEKLYIELLLRFAAKYRDSHTELHSLVEQQNIEGAARLAHTIKGVAANLGAGALADLVKKIETAILSGQQLHAELELYGRELRLVTQSINALGQRRQAEADPAAEAHTLDTGTVQRIRTELDALPHLMQTDWGQAQEKVEELVEILNGTGAAHASANLRNALEEFDVNAFTEAIREVHSLL